MAQDWVGSAMLAERNRLAKMLNQRMVRLEKAGINYGAIAQYKDWVKEYYGESKTGKLRFPERRTASSASKWKHNVSLRKELDKLNYFASTNWITSTVSGTRQLEKQRKENFENAFGLHFPRVEIMNEFLESESWKVLKKIYGSALALRLAGKRKYRRGTEKSRSTVAAMDARLAAFLERRGDNYNLREMTSEDIQAIFGLSSKTITQTIEEMEDKLPL